MTPKQKAIEMVSKQFDVLAKASNYKGLKKEGEKKFYTIEKVAKESVKLSVLELITAFENLSIEESGRINIDFRHEFWREVFSEIDNL